LKSFNSKSKNGELISENDSGLPLFQVPLTDRTGNLTMTKELEIIRMVTEKQYAFSEVVKMLEEMGWEFQVPVPSSVYLASYISLPPWGRIKLDSGAPLIMNFDYFNNNQDLALYIRQHGINEVQDVDKNAQGRPKRINTESAKGSESIGGSISIKDSEVNRRQPKRQSSSAADSSKDDSIVGTKEMEGKGLSRKQRAAESVKESESTVGDVEGERRQSRRQSESASNTCDRCPMLGTRGLEGELKKIINDAGDTYLYPLIAPVLEQLGWRENVKYRRDYVTLSAWGAEKFLKGVEPILLDVGCDYFTSNRDIVEYILLHGHRPINSEGQDIEAPSRSVMSHTMPPPAPARQSVPHSKPIQTKRLVDLSVEEALTIDHEDEKEIVDKCPKLSTEGLEGNLKSIINSAGDAYVFSQIFPILEELGWRTYVRIRGDYYTMAPWGSEKMRISEDESTLALGVDYFLDNRQIVDYLMLHGHQAVEPEWSPLAHTSRSNRVRKQNMPPSVVQTIPKVTHKSRSAPPTAVQRGDDITLSQIVLEDVILPPIDTRCSAEIKHLVKAAMFSRPRLNVSLFSEVWPRLHDFGWRWVYRSGNQSGSRYYGRPYVDEALLKSKKPNSYKIGEDYFAEEVDVLLFIKNQLLARGRSYDTLVDRAKFFPNSDYSDEEDEDSTDESEINEDNVVTRKLPHRSLYKSGEPYETYYQNFDKDNNASDDELDDLPSFCSPTAPPLTVPQNTLVEESTDTAPSQSTDAVIRPTALFEADLQSPPEKKRKMSSVSEDDVGGAEPAKKSRCSSPDINATLSATIKRVQSRLCPSYVPSVVYGRQKESTDLYEGISQALKTGTEFCVRLAGQPGLGKTLTTKCVMDTLTKERDAGRMPSFDLVWINCAETNSFVHLSRTRGMRSHNEEIAKVDVLSRVIAPDQDRIIFVFDECDMLPKPMVDLLVRKSLPRAIVVALSNTIVTGVTFDEEILFEVYTEAQLNYILKSLTENLFEPSALSLTTKICQGTGVNFFSNML
jgi:hypothetical protein